MLNVPIYISWLFGSTTCLAVLMFYLAANRSKRTLVIMLAWLALQTPVALSGFYAKTDVLPPRCVLLFWPPVLLSLALCLTKRGRVYLDGLNLKMLTLLHTVRILTAVFFFCLYVNKAVPRLLTFEGWNFDVLAGLTAPVMVYLGFVRKSISRRFMWYWNLAGLALLVNLVVTAILSAPFPFQQLGFDQPDIAFLYFPFIWMSGGVVPLLLLAHLAAMRQLQTSHDTAEILTETKQQTTKP